MNITDVKKEISTKREELLKQYEVLAPVVCTHLVCPECLEKEKNNALIRDTLSTLINDLDIVISKIK